MLKTYGNRKSQIECSESSETKAFKSFGHEQLKGRSCPNRVWEEDSHQFLEGAVLRTNHTFSKRVSGEGSVEQGYFAGVDKAHFTFFSEAAYFAAQKSYYISLENFLFNFSR